MKNVVSPFLKDLITDWKNQKFFIIVNESTNISTHKNFGILMSYFSKKVQSVATRFLVLFPIPETTEMIFHAIEKKSRNVIKL